MELKFGAGVGMQFRDSVKYEIIKLKWCGSVCMVTFQEISYSSWSDLSSKPKYRVIIRNKNGEYSCLYSIVVDVLNNEKLEMQSEKIHKEIDKLFCIFLFSLRVNPNSFVTSLILKTTFAVDISPRFKHFNLIYFTLSLIAYQHPRHIPYLS